MLGKEECAAVPVFLLLLDTSRKHRLAWKPLAGMLGVALALGLRTVWATTVVPGSQAGLQAGISPLSYFATEGVAVLRYLRMVILPWGFTVDPQIDKPSLPLAALAWGLVAVLILAASRRFGNLREGFWLLGGLILLAPSSTILPAADLAVDRRMYLPMIAFSALLGLLLERTNWKTTTPIVLVLAAVSFHYASLWRNPEELWTEAVRQSPEKIRPRIQLARSVEPGRALSIPATPSAWPQIMPRCCRKKAACCSNLDEPVTLWGRSGVRWLLIPPTHARSITAVRRFWRCVRQKRLARTSREHSIAIHVCLTPA